MNTKHLCKTVLSASIAAALGLGLAACNPASPPASQTQALSESDGAAISETASLDGAIAGAQEAISDTWITTKVKSELLADSLSQGFEVSVETHDGIVVLEGMLPNQDAIDHVIEIALSVDGVQRVDGSALSAERG